MYWGQFQTRVGEIGPALLINTFDDGGDRLRERFESSSRQNDGEYTRLVVDRLTRRLTA
jgi:hypothetical protein